MHGYEPIDLSPHTNAGPDGFVSTLRPEVGTVTLRGLPFRIGSGRPDDPRPFVRLGPGGHAGPLRLVLPWPARTIVIAHLLLDSEAPVGGLAGAAGADYEIGLEETLYVTEILTFNKDSVAWAVAESGVIGGWIGSGHEGCGMLRSLTPPIRPIGSVDVAAVGARSSHVGSDGRTTSGLVDGALRH